MFHDHIQNIHAIQGHVQRAIKVQAAQTTEVQTQAKEEFYEV